MPTMTSVNQRVVASRASRAAAPSDEALTVPTRVRALTVPTRARAARRARERRARASGGDARDDDASRDAATRARARKRDMRADVCGFKTTRDDAQLKARRSMNKCKTMR